MGEYKKWEDIRRSTPERREEIRKQATQDVEKNEDPVTAREIHRDKWLDSLTLDELKKWVRKNSCLCDMAGICNACELADLKFDVELGDL